MRLRGEKADSKNVGFRIRNVSASVNRASDGSHYEKRGKGEPVCIDDEIPFEIPESWAWARIETISTDPRYGTSAKSQKTGELPVLRMGNITKDGGLDYSNLVFTSDKNEIETYRLSPGAVIFNRTNSREWVGKTAYYDGSVPAIYAGYLIAFYPIQLLGEYVNYAMCSPYERDWCKRVKSDGINQSNINSQKLKSFLLPVPPLEEQKRIVSLLNETMPYVDQYSALEDARERLDAELPDRLRKSILQMAVQGKLVSQDPADEPASALLERIRAERAKLIKEKKLKAPKGGESVIYRASDGGYYEKRSKGEPQPIEVPFGIPESWEWARIGSVFDMQAGKNIAAANISDIQDEKHPYPCFGGNGIRGYVQEPNRNGRYPIVGRQGALCGCVNYAEGELYATEHAVVTTCFDKTDVSWACIVLEALNLNQYATATAQPGLAVSKIVDVFIPVPPAGEQARIAEVYEAYKRFTNQ